MEEDDDDDDDEFFTYLKVVNIINHSYENIPWVLVRFGFYTAWSVKTLFLDLMQCELAGVSVFWNGLAA